MPVIPPIVEAGSVLSEGDAAIRGPPHARTDRSGSARRSGSSRTRSTRSAAGVAGSQASGDLPADVTVLQDDPSGSDEGRAMAEIVHDEAPARRDRLRDGRRRPRLQGRRHRQLRRPRRQRDRRRRVYPGEPFFQDDVIAQAVDRAKARGTAYFAAAGNQRGNGWEGVYAPTPIRARSATTEDFDPGPGVDTVQTVGTIAANGDAAIVVQWAEPWGHALDRLRRRRLPVRRRRAHLRLHGGHEQPGDRHPRGVRPSRTAGPPRSSASRSVASPARPRRGSSTSASRTATHLHDRAGLELRRHRTGCGLGARGARRRRLALCDAVRAGELQLAGPWCTTSTPPGATLGTPERARGRASRRPTA